MEYTTSIDALSQHTMAGQVEETKTQTKKSTISLPVCIYLMQAICYVLQVKAATANAFSTAITALAILTSLSGIAVGIVLAHRKSAIRGLNCAAVNVAGLLFWTVQFLFRSMPF